MGELLRSRNLPVGCGEIRKEILGKLSQIAKTDIEVLITDPTGVGKEFYAQFLHSQIPRQNEDSVPVNLGCLRSEQLENELFGHVSGVFTRAGSTSHGLLEAAPP